MVSGWGSFGRDSTHTGTAVQLLQRTPRASSVREDFKAACRRSKSCLLISHTAFTPEALQRASRDPEGEPGSRGRAGIQSAHGQQGRPAWQGAGAGPGHSSRRAWDGALPVGRRGVKSHSTERDFLAPTESLGAGG